MTPTEPNEKLSRRDFLLLALAGTGGIFWMFTRQDPDFLAPDPTPSPASPTASPPAVKIASPVELVTIQPAEENILVSYRLPSLNEQRAIQAYQAVVQNFAIPGSTLFKETIQPTDQKYAAYLWPYSCVLSALAALASTPSQGANYSTELARLLPGLDAYYDRSSQPPGYESYLLEQGGGDKFYDDNEWLGFIFLDAYRLFKQDIYLAKAIETFNFAISGWSDEMGGGIFWQASDHRTKNTCSNAPAAALALEIYRVTGEEKYLQWAQKILPWVEQLKSPQNNLYWDNVDSGGNIDRSQYTYNTGEMIHANALLYALLRDPKYLDEARSLAEASYQSFPGEPGRSGIGLYHDDPWFIAVLMRGFLALYEADPAKDRKFIDHMRQNLDVAWDNARDAKGLFNPNWQGPADEKPTKKLIDQAAMVELFALASRLDG